MKRLPIIQEARIPFTQDGYDTLLQEKSKLLSERPDAVENLRKAREMGDLSENGYYKASRARLSFIDARLKRLERLIRLAVIVQATRSDVVQIGSTVTVSMGGKLLTYTLVGGYESDPSKQTISHISPIGKALLGKHVGESVKVQAPKGQFEMTITAITVE